MEEQKDNPQKEFKIIQLKFEHFHFYDGDITVGMPISTSIELACNYSFEKGKLDWKKIIKHSFFSNEYPNKKSEIVYDEVLNDEKLIAKLSNYDLRPLGNNYYTDIVPDNYSHWELSYNNYFKIAGTYDLMPLEVKEISKLLDFDDIMEKVVFMVKERMNTIIDREV